MDSAGRRWCETGIGAVRMWRARPASGRASAGSGRRPVMPTPESMLESSSHTRRDQPPYLAVTSVTEEVGAKLQQLIGEGMAKGGPLMATELFLRWVAGDETFESLDPELRDRMLGNGEVLFSLETEGINAYLPAPEQLAEVGLPCVVAAGAPTTATLRRLTTDSTRLRNGSPTVSAPRSSRHPGHTCPRPHTRERSQRPCARSWASYPPPCASRPEVASHSDHRPRHATPRHQAGRRRRRRREERSGAANTGVDRPRSFRDDLRSCPGGTQTYALRGRQAAVRVGSPPSGAEVSAGAHPSMNGSEQA
jgi:hypothetical protein